MSNTENTATPVDTAPVLALVESARTAWGEALQGTRRSVEALAVATFAAKPFIGGEAALFADVDAYRQQFPSLTGDGAISKSYVTLMARVGKCHSLGITPESDATTWGRLVQKANSDARIRKAIDDEKATKTKVVKAVKSAYPGGTYTKPASESDAPAEGENHGNTGSNAETQTVPASVPGLLDMLDVIVARLASEPITKGEHARIASVVESLGSLTASDSDTVEAHRAA